MTILWIALALLLTFGLAFFLIGEKSSLKNSTKNWFKTSGVKRFFNLNPDMSG